MNHGSLFSGIGGFDLAAQWMGWNNVFHCEWNEFGQRILKYYWPHAKTHTDITTTDFRPYRGKIDILTGGFPCQPYSTAGKRLGKEDARHLWPKMLRAIREIKPRYVVGENVSGIVSWNGGLVFEEVQADLEAKGYEVQSVLLPACSVGAPHRRDRVWFVSRLISNSGSNRQQFTKEFKEGRECESSGIPLNESNALHGGGITTNTNSAIIQSKCKYRQEEREPIRQDIGVLHTEWQDFPTQPPVYNGNDGFSSRLDGITFPKWRNESIKAGGNAIVPQVAYQIFKALNSDIKKKPL